MRAGWAPAGTDGTLPSDGTAAGSSAWTPRPAAAPAVAAAARSTPSSVPPPAVAAPAKEAEDNRCCSWVPAVAPVVGDDTSSSSVGPSELISSGNINTRTRLKREKFGVPHRCLRPHRHSNRTKTTAKNDTKKRWTLRKRRPSGATHSNSTFTENPFPTQCKRTFSCMQPKEIAQCGRKPTLNGWKRGGVALGPAPTILGLLPPFVNTNFCVFGHVSGRIFDKKLL